MIRIGIICPSEIAFRRFMPALKKNQSRIEFVGIAYASPEEWFGDINNISKDIIIEQQERELAKAKAFTDAFGGIIYRGYQKLTESSEIDAIYLPLPPALHYHWAKMALENGKHVFVEKPSTTCLADTDSLISIASEKKLALHENYMFIFHKQLSTIQDIVSQGEIGDIRLYRISFGFPMRQKNDFRYNKTLGGGAVLDAGGYVLKYATYLLGETAHLVTASSNHIQGFDVDMYGSATIVNNKNQVAQVAFGMDNDYKCEIEIWGSKGTLYSGRVLTAPEGFTPSCIIRKNQKEIFVELPEDDSFKKSIEHFLECIVNESVRLHNYKVLHKQEEMVESFIKLSQRK